MNRVSTRSRVQPTKPIIITLRKSELGYKLEGSDQNTSTTISIPKNVITKPEPKATIAPTKVETPSSMNPLAPTNVKKQVQQSRPIPIQKPVTATTEVPTNISRTIVPPTKPDLEAKKREIYPYTSFGALPSEGSRGRPPNPVPTDDYRTPSFGNSLLSNREGADVGTIAQKITDSKAKSNLVILPSCASWFDMHEIHQIEKDSLPEFFCGKPSKTPQIYKRYRNYIIQLYRQNPKTYLNSTTCRHSLAGDACAIMRIHSFLEHWGIINFNVDSSTVQQNALITKPSTDVNQRIVDFTKKHGRRDFFDQEKKLYGAPDDDGMLNHVKMITKSIRPVCDFCGLICGSVWFQQKPLDLQSEVQGEPTGQPNQSVPKQITKGAELILCVKCYTDGKIPNIFSANDFVKVDLIEKLNSEQAGRSQDTWTPEETLQLLDLVSKYNDNWKEIQRYFPTRTKEEIILHFLQLPAKNITSINLLEANEQPDDKPPSSEKIPESQLTCLNDYSNPLFHHVAIFKNLLEKCRAKKVKKEQPKPVTVEATANEGEAKKEAESQPEAKAEAQTEAEAGNQESEIKEIKENKSPEIKESKAEEIAPTKHAEITMEIEPEDKEKEAIAKEKAKKQELAAQLIDIQLKKLDEKLNFLEEYEKIIWNEKKQLEILQKMQTAERVHLASKKNELFRHQQHLQGHSHHYPHQHQPAPQPHYQSAGMGGMMSNPQQHMPPQRDEVRSRGAIPGGSAPMSIEDMLNLGGGMGGMDDEFGKGDQLFFKHD